MVCDGNFLDTKVEKEDSSRRWGIQGTFLPFETDEVTENIAEEADRGNDSSEDDMKASHSAEPDCPCDVGRDVTIADFETAKISFEDRQNLIEEADKPVKTNPGKGPRAAPKATSAKAVMRGTPNPLMHSSIDSRVATRPALPPSSRPRLTSAMPSSRIP
ncbi:hypothetical protein [Halorhabdus rudnickae]|uniref:hypothetical protein n=1 Tax=Halorhabdus rudnickae TaxID=1775544 RepID=UPI001AF0072C|nr:hypothetical protein [Halorhabdus rudnickae]